MTRQGSSSAPGGLDLPRDFGTLLPEIVAPPPGPRSLEMARRLSAVESRNVTYLSPGFPVFWEAARGANVRDVDGNVYLDLTAAFGVAVTGHGDEAVIGAMGDQAGRLVHGMGDVHPPAAKVEFLEALADLAPWPESRAILGSSGSEAVEAALKTALMATGKPGILAFEGAYHGLTLGSLAATARHHFRAPFEERLYRGVRFVPFPDPLRSGEMAGPGSLAAVEDALEKGIQGSGIGAVIIEPVQGRAGVRIPPPGFLRELGGLARDAGALLIFDEIFTGLGRTGSVFACTGEDVFPDLLCLGKGLGGGLPLSACLGPPEIMDAWPRSDGEAIHTSTFLGHPLACASGRALLRALEGRGLVARSMELGGSFLEGLRRELAGEAAVVDVRGRGLFIGVELADPESRTPLAGAAVAAAEAALRRGILLLPAGSHGHVLELSPPLVITEAQIEWAVPRLGESIREGRAAAP